MLEYLGPELPWELCRTYEELAIEPGYCFFTSARSNHHLYYLQENFIWCQSSVEYHVAAICPCRPIALRWYNKVLFALLSDGQCYVLKEEYQADGCTYVLEKQGPAFGKLRLFYD